VFDQTAYRHLRRGKAMPQAITIPEVDNATAS
jgi:hypothetical protein